MRTRALAATLGLAGAMFLAWQWFGKAVAPRGRTPQEPSAVPATIRTAELAEVQEFSSSRREAIPSAAGGIRFLPPEEPRGGMATARARVRGRVVPPEGLALDGETRAAAWVEVDGVPLRGGLTPELGFKLADLAPGTHRVGALVPGFEPAEWRGSLEPGEERVLVAGSTIGGVVRRGDGQPAGKVNVAISGPGESRSTWTDAAGRFRGEGLGDGPFALEAKSPADGSASPIARGVFAGTLDLELVVLTLEPSAK